MPLIAHLTDFHLLEDRPQQRRLTERVRLGYLSLGRPIDPLGRKERAAAALAEARLAGPDHLVITGDLTEDGTSGQFEVLAELLHQSGLGTDAITLVPGNHDAYSGADAWQRALFGPLAPWRKTSAANKPIELGDVQLVAVSTVMPQPVWRSAGLLGRSELERILRAARDASTRRHSVLVVQHHGAFPHRLPGAQWMDGLQNAGHMLDVLRRFDQISVLHGHDHRASERAMFPEERARVFCAPAVIDSDSPLRLYWCDQSGAIPIADEPLVEVMAPAAA
jgi:3',5'-cyclic AMP phosphodiesterase CpdA